MSERETVDKLQDLERRIEALEKIVCAVHGGPKEHDEYAKKSEYLGVPAKPEKKATE